MTSVSPSAGPERRAERVDEATVTRFIEAYLRMEPDLIDIVEVTDPVTRKAVAELLTAALTEQGAAGRGESVE